MAGDVTRMLVGGANRISVPDRFDSSWGALALLSLRSPWARTPRARAARCIDPFSPPHDGLKGSENPAPRREAGRILSAGSLRRAAGSRERSAGIESGYSADLAVEVVRLTRRPTTPTAARTASTRRSFFMGGACQGVYGRASPSLRAP